MNICVETQQLAIVPTQEDPRWNALVARDAAADGQFFYSVKTTGVYCVPSCAARLPKPENVRFHQTREEAEQAGFRPCKRCKPNHGGAKRQRAAREIRFTIGESPLGLTLVAQSETGLCALLPGEDRETLSRELADRFPNATLTNDEAELAPLFAEVVAFLSVPAATLDMPLDLHGTEFQQRVWQALREIPVGSTASYLEIANQIGQPKAVRAVAQACGANHLAVVVPCHRVVRSDGGLSGYRWGVAWKRALLDREATV